VRKWRKIAEMVQGERCERAKAAKKGFKMPFLLRESALDGEGCGGCAPKTIFCATFEPID
jgi:hypothetical protein